MADPPFTADGWEDFVGEIREVYSEDAADWGGLDDVTIARYASGECSADELDQIGQTLNRHPVAREAVSILKDMMQDSQLLSAAAGQVAGTGTARLYDATLDGAVNAVRDLRRKISGFDWLVSADDDLFGAIATASQKAEEDREFACGDAILDYDRLFLMAAGGGEDEVEISTSPLWYSKLRTLPRQLWWGATPDVTADQLSVRVLIDGKEVISEVVTQNELRLPPSMASTSSTIHWEVVEPGETDPLVRAVFELLDSDRTEEIEQELRGLDVAEDVFERELAACVALFNFELFDEAILKLRDLEELFPTGIAKFVIHRSMAAVYCAISRRLSGKPFWMGDREGLWASEKAGDFLQSAWAAIGICYRT